MGEIVKAHRVQVKVCCISSTDEAQLALACGADALGLVGDMPSGPGVISDKLVRQIAGSVPQSVDTFLLTSRQTAQDIIDHVAYCGTTTVQVVQHIDPAHYPRLRQALPRVKMVQVIHVEDWQAVDLAVSYEPFVDALLLDSGKPAAAIAELGGTGRTHDWQVSAKIVAATTKPVYLAGGLAPAKRRCCH